MQSFILKFVPYYLNYDEIMLNKNKTISINLTDEQYQPQSILLDRYQRYPEYPDYYDNPNYEIITVFYYQNWNRSDDISYLTDIARPITKRYTCRLYSDWGGRSHPLNRIVQFDSPEFIQGSISVCTWYGVDPHHNILDLYDGY